MKFDHIFSSHTRLPVLSPYAKKTGVIMEGYLEKKNTKGLGLWTKYYYTLISIVLVDHEPY